MVKQSLLMISQRAILPLQLSVPLEILLSSAAATLGYLDVILPVVLFRDMGTREVVYPILWQRKSHEINAPDTPGKCGWHLYGSFIVD